MQSKHAFTLTNRLDNVDWVKLKAVLAADRFDNGRTPDELHRSFANSFVCVFAVSGDQVIGTARALSDGVCNAFVIDVWTQTEFRRNGVARSMMKYLEDQLVGQHVALITDSAQDFYSASEYSEEQTGMSKVVGVWLNRVKAVG
jgi:ribosomal protein S18 acetylase RimI-like enzyme